MSYNLVEAGAATGKSRSTILRAIRRGILSATRDVVSGGWLIEPAELHRIYPPVALSGHLQADDLIRNKDGLPSEGELRELRARLEDAHEQVIDLRRRLDQADANHRQALDRLAAAQERIAALLTDQRPARRRWWWRGTP